MMNVNETVKALMAFADEYAAAERAIECATDGSDSEQERRTLELALHSALTLILSRQYPVHPCESLVDALIAECEEAELVFGPKNPLNLHSEAIREIINQHIGVE
jgi:hypothetical protein